MSFTASICVWMGSCSGCSVWSSPWAVSSAGAYSSFPSYWPPYRASSASLFSQLASSWSALGLHVPARLLSGGAGLHLMALSAPWLGAVRGGSRADNRSEVDGIVAGAGAEVGLGAPREAPRRMGSAGASALMPVAPSSMLSSS